MAIPNSIEARLIYRCAFQRHEDAQILLRNEHTTGAVYLSGYGVECILKALLLDALVPVQRQLVLESFRGKQAHDFDWLRTQYLVNRGSRFPPFVSEAFTLVKDWSTDMRYWPRTLKTDEAEGFLNAARTILEWADGRL